MQKFQRLQKFMKYSPWLWVPSLSFSDALPNVVVMAISVILYKQMGLSNAAITFYTSWLYLPWILKPVWAPFIDLIKTKRWWIVGMEILLGAALGGIAFTIPTTFWLQGTLFLFWVIAFTGASHCVAADGFYMLGLDHSQQAWFIGVRSIAERLATIFGQGFLVMIAGNVQVLFRGSISYMAWQGCFLLFGCGTKQCCLVLPMTCNDDMLMRIRYGMAFQILLKHFSKRMGFLLFCPLYYCFECLRPFCQR